ncbi:MAG: TlpA family protein disulfide reductase, partial [Phycisphaerae bacterium]|nr:TlpA family protein disulfide reductase [Phycisphaerae bacterium]
MLVLLLLLPAPQGVAPPPVEPDEALWRRILELSTLPAAPASQPYEAHVADIRDRRTRLVELARSYRALHPGGRRRDEVIRIELQALFDLGALDRGDFTALCREVDDLLRHPPSQDALHEAAYWAITCRRLSQADPRRPAFAALSPADARLIEEYREYIRRYPASRHVPRLAQIVGEAAHREFDEAIIDELADVCRRHHAGHATTRWLEGLLRRREALGAPFDAELTLLDGSVQRVSAWRGTPVLVVVWSAEEGVSEHRVREIAEFAGSKPELRVIGVNLDDSVAECSTAAARMGLTWPQHVAPFGPGGAFAQRWGIRRAPVVFVIDRAGRLVAVSEGSEW